MKTVRTELRSLSPSERAKIVGRLREEGRLKGRSSTERETIPRADREGPLPLGPLQKSYWFLESAEEGAPGNLPFSVLIRGDLQEDCLEAALREIVRRHEILRTVYRTTDGVLQQVIRADVDFRIEREELSELPRKRARRQADRLRNESINRRFDLKEDVPLRVLLVKFSEQVYFLTWTFNHIAMDGWSRAVFRRELRTLYKALVAGKPSPLAELPIQYYDYVAWRNQTLSGDNLRRLKGYWGKKLANAPLRLDLPSDVRSERQRFSGRSRSIVIGSETIEALGRLDAKASLFNVLVAAVNILLWRYTGDTRVLISTGIAARTRPELEPLIGYFASTLLLYTDLEGAGSFRDVLRRAWETCHEAFDHQGLPIQEINAAVTEETGGAPPVSGVALLLQNAVTEPFALDSLQCEVDLTEARAIRGFLEFHCKDSTEGLYIECIYAEGRFSGKLVERMLAHLQAVMETAAREPDKPLVSLDFLSQDDAAAIHKGGQGRQVHRRPICLHQLFEEQVVRTPNRTALVDHKKKESLTYAQLNSMSNHLAHTLLEKGLKSGDIVGLCTRSGFAMVVGILGILKSGAAYTPLNPDDPESRLKRICADCQARFVVTDGSRNELSDCGVELVLQESSYDKGRAQPKPNPDITVSVGSLAYVLYTSGSTGEPKGVRGLHSGAANRIQWMLESFPYQQDDVACQTASFTFVDSIPEIFTPLSAGVALVILDKDTTRERREMVKAMTEHRVSHLILVPSALRELLKPEFASQLSHLRFCVSSGEYLLPDLVSRFHHLLPGKTLLNLYGSTEVTGDVTCLVTSLKHGRAWVPVGKPISNTTLFVLDSQLELAPLGVVGTLYVAGDNLADGYTDPEETERRFVKTKHWSSALFRTGDRARWLADGNLELLGREDAMLNLRGFRVEPGEIETHLNSLSSVRKSAVTKCNKSGALVAFLEAEDADPLEIREYLLDQLPEWMIPSRFIRLDSLPLTSSGKVDRRKLSIDKVLPKEEKARPPKTPAERVLVKVWEEVLQIKPIGLHHHFFLVGGHSLLVVTMQDKIEKLFHVELPIRSFFENPTVDGLIQTLSEILGGREELEKLAELWETVSEMSDEEVRASLTGASETSGPLH